MTNEITNISKGTTAAQNNISTGQEDIKIALEDFAQLASSASVLEEQANFISQII